MNVACPQKFHVLEAWSTVRLCWKVVAFKRWSLVGRKSFVRLLSLEGIKVVPMWDPELVPKRVNCYKSKPNPESLCGFNLKV
jgi:hypothetical protein